MGLLHNLARKWIRPILQVSGATRGTLWQAEVFKNGYALPGTGKHHRGCKKYYHNTRKFTETFKSSNALTAFFWLNCYNTGKQYAENWTHSSRSYEQWASMRKRRNTWGFRQGCEGFMHHLKLCRNVNTVKNHWD